MKNLNNLCNLAKHYIIAQSPLTGANLSFQILSSPSTLSNIHSWSYLTEQVENILYHVPGSLQDLGKMIFQRRDCWKGVFILILALII